MTESPKFYTLLFPPMKEHLITSQPELIRKWNEDVGTAPMADQRCIATQAALAESADDEVAELLAWLRATAETLHEGNIQKPQLTRAANLLERLVPQPVPVTERLPRPEDCIANPRNGQGQWCWGWCVDDSAVPFSGRWRMIRRQWLADEAVAWLPAHALPVPS